MKQLRKLYLGTVLSLGTLAGLGLATQSQAFEAATRAIDFNKVNQNIQRGLDEVVSISSATLRKFTLRFDARQTNVDNDTYTVTTNLTLPKTLWSDRSLRASARMSLKVDRVASEGNSASDKVKFGLSARLNTDSLAMIKYIGKNMSCPTPENIVGVARISMDEHCRTANDLQQVQDIASLRALVKDHLDKMQADLKNYADQARQDLQQIHNDIVKQQIEHEIQIAEKLQNASANAQIADAQNGFSVEFKDLELSPHAKLDTLKITVEAKRFSVELTAQSDVGAKIYRLTKPEVVRMLRALEDNEDWAVKQVQMETRIMNVLLSAFVEGTDLSQAPVTTSR